jgi:hypothetical protein
MPQSGFTRCGERLRRIECPVSALYEGVRRTTYNNALASEQRTQFGFEVHELGCIVPPPWLIPSLLSIENVAVREWMAGKRYSRSMLFVQKENLGER